MIDLDIVQTVCRLVADRAGDPAALVRDEVRRLAPLCSHDEQHEIAERAIAHLAGLGDLDIHLRDPAVDEVLVNGGREIWVDRDGALQHVGILDDGGVELLIERVLAPLGRRLDRTSPIVDARLADGSRVCAVLPPIAVDGPALSIRRFRSRALTLDVFTDAGGCELLRQLVAERCNIVVSGATSSGKTSLVSALLAAATPSERMVVVEDTTELAVTHPHVVRLEARPPSIDGPGAVDLAQLVRTALRLRPDRIVVGEVRGDETLALVQAMNTGHDGSISTCHANGPVDAMLRLESLVLQASPAWPLAAIRHQLSRSIDVVVHVARRADGTRHVDAISEVDEPRAMTIGDPPALRPLARCDSHGRFDLVAEPRRRRR